MENKISKADLYGIIKQILNRVSKSILMILNTRTKRVVCCSICGFTMGLCATFFTVLIYNHWNERTGIGGLETATALISVENSHVSDDDLLMNELLSNFDEEAAKSTDHSYENDLAGDEAVEPVTYQTYRVKAGDMIGIIADKYDITQDTIISVNNIRQSRLIQPGQYLKIPSSAGILYTVKNDSETLDSIAEKYEIDAEKIASANSLKVGMGLKSGTTLFLPDAQMDWATRQEINGDLFHKPIKARYWLSSSYGWRDSPFSGNRSFHSGADMACPQGTPVYAALDGKVTTTGYNETYGNYIIITHHSGYKSLYAHLSSINCKKGNFVYTNTVIGKVGNTGLSTGPHLHFTVYKNGVTVNPLSLIN